MILNVSLHKRLAFMESFFSCAVHGFLQPALAQNSEGLKYILSGTNSKELLLLSERLRIQSETKHDEAKKVAMLKGWIVKKSFQDGKGIELKELDETGRPVYYTTWNVNAAKQSPQINSGRVVPWFVPFRKRDGTQGMG